ncbi:MAG TPA: MFS transporter, partial [Bdellovibrionales bacterium]|nr:MFS transporter [Bdellovibrionales bacterium]
YPPNNLEELQAQKNKGLWAALKQWAVETKSCYFQMPPIMKRLAVIQFFTWMGLFCMWMYYSVAVPHDVFGATDPNSELYETGVRFAAHTTMIRGISTPIFALCIPLIAKQFGRAHTHAFALLVCGLGLLSIPFIHEPGMLYLPMIAAGIGWASIVSMPYVILVEHLPPNQYGIFMGIFNMFIVIPEILVSVGLGPLIMKLVNNSRASGVAFGGALIVIAALLTLSLRKFEAKQT